MDFQKLLSFNRDSLLYHRFSDFISSSAQGKQQANWIIFSRCLQPSDFDELNGLASGNRLSIADLWKVGSYDVALIQGELIPEHASALETLKLDYARLDSIPDLSEPGLILMDMDSTVIQIECIDEIAMLAGVGELVSEVTERAMQGELDFEQSLRQRVKLLSGADESILASVRSTLPLMPGLQELLHALRAVRWKTAIASGGFTYFSDYLKEKLQLDYARSNVLEIENGLLTGHVLGDVVSAQTKADILVELVNHYEIKQSNTIAVGDGANDLIMMGASGLGVAYHAKPKVVEAAQVAIRYSDLSSILCLLSAKLVQNAKID